MKEASVRVLLVEDDPDDYVLTRDLLEQIEGVRVYTHWSASCTEGLRALREGAFDVVLLDYRLGAQTALDFLGRMPLEENTPVILLTGQPDRQTDIDAMKAGAADYLVKSEITSTLLDRSIRYATERHRAQEAKRQAEEFRLGQVRVLEMIARGAPLHDVLRELIRNAEAGRDLRCAILLVTPGGERLRVGAAPSLPQELRDASEGMLIGPVSGSCGTSAYRREKVVVADTAADPLWADYRAMAERAEVRACWSRPVLSKTGTVLGTVCTYYREPRPPTPEEEGLIENIAQIAAIAIERDASETALRASEERFRSLVHATAQIVWRTDRESGGLPEHSPGWLDFTGQAAEETAGRGWLHAVHPEDRESLVEALRRSIQEKQVFESEHRLRRHDGEYRHMQVRGVPLLEPDGSIREWVGMHTDITERKTAECAVRESEQKFREVAGHIQQVIWIFDPEFTQAIYISPAYEQIWGAPVETVYQDPRSFLAAIHPDDLEHVIATMEQIRHSVVDACEYRLLHPSRGERWLRSRGFAVRDENGIVQRVVGTSEDITDLVRARFELERSEAQYRRLVRTAPQAIYALDVEGRFIEVNTAAEELLGRPSSDLIGESFGTVIAPEDLPRLRELREQKMNEGEAIAEAECEIIRPSGERRLIQINASVVREGERVLGTQGIARDITEERARDARMRLLTSVLEGLEQGVSVTSFRTRRFLYRNAAWGRLLGCDPDDQARYTPSDFFPDEAAREQNEEILSNLRQYGQWSGRILRKRIDDGTLVPLDVVLGTAEGEGGDTIVFSVFHDASEVISREQRLRRAERLASLGTMIGGVAHELNNPMHAIRNFADLMLMEERNDEDREALEIVRREADRASKIVSNLRLFARQTQDQVLCKREAVDLNDIVHHVLKIRGYTLSSHNIHVEQDLGHTLPKASADQNEIEQVVLNLVINAEQALVGNRSTERALVFRTRARRGRVVLQVIDNGPGIAPEHLGRIFDPFFTTKSPGEGTGLGLSLAHHIVEEHGGELSVESRLGEGAAFSLELPQHDNAGVAELNEETAPLPAAERSLRILVIDDETSVRRIATQFLQRRGHHVDNAADGEEALVLLSSREYDVIVSDLRMPGMDGEELLKHLKARGRGLEQRVILLTGDASSPHVHLGVPVLSKPMKLTELGSLNRWRISLDLAREHANEVGRNRARSPDLHNRRRRIERPGYGAHV